MSVSKELWEYQHRVKEMKGRLKTIEGLCVWWIDNREIENLNPKDICEEILRIIRHS